MQLVVGRLLQTPCVQCLVVCLQAQYRLTLVVDNGFSTLFIPSVPIGPSGKYQKSKIQWSMLYVRGPLGAIFGKFALIDFTQRRPNHFRKKPDCSGTANPEG